jgi:hypothetical protein
MPVTFSNSQTVISDNWTYYKSIIISKNISVQYLEESSVYSIFSFDGQLVYSCIIYKGDVPYGVSLTYSQAQNDADKSDFENNYKNNANKCLDLKDSENRSIVVSEPRIGSEVIYATHNFCDRTTWFGDSVRVNDETLTDSGDGYVFNSQHINWIDMRTGRVLDDDGLAQEQQLLNPGDPHGYQVIVNVDGYLKSPHDIFETTGGDYEIFYDDGYVKFAESQAGKTVTASYSYENGSTFYAKPLPGKTLKIEAAEADFSDDIGQIDTIEYSVWGLVDVFAPQYLDTNGGPYPSGTKIPLKQGYYKRYTQILREAIGAFPSLHGNGVLDEHKGLSMKEFRRQSRGGLHTIQSVPFRYATVRDLFSDYGMELRVKLLNDREFYGEISTITFYCTSINKGS